MPDSSESEIVDVQDSVIVARPVIHASKPAPELAGFQLWLSTNRDAVFRLSMATFVIVFVSVGLTMWMTGNLNAQNLGYGGVWLVSFIAAGSIVIPLPGPVAVCIAAAPTIGLNPVLIGLVSASAEALGEMTGYIAGLSGRSLLERNKYYPRIHSLLQRRGGIFLFFGAIIPNPLFDVLGIAAGSIGYPIKRFIAVVFIAKAIKSSVIAYLCLLGIEWATKWFI
ncbi:MAG: VTT domain-containing protein [Chloroflexi bacterium]|nr:VTT domain-containing protein [Chloroflexota bacterium]